jgi:hypothetical protein
VGANFWYNFRKLCFDTELRQTAGHFDEKSKVFSFAVLYNERGVGSLYNKIQSPL